MTLLSFLKDWLAWAETRPVTKRYSTQRGLCACIAYYTMGENKQQNEPLRLEILGQLHALLNAQYVHATQRDERDLNTSARPFGGVDVYHHETATATAHKNPARLAWVRKTIKELEDGTQQA